ncbi:MAG: allantoinase AllB [bacterium]|nr:allantoinase AllB [bacterium]
MKFVLENVRVPAGGNTLRPARMAVASGRVVAWDEECPVDWAREDGQGLVLLPGVIDPHTHFDEPGYTWREDFAHGSRAAVAGGVTTIFDMPDTSVPPVTTRAALAEKVSAVLPHAMCDFGLWGGVSANALEDPGWPRHMQELWEAGVIGFKTYALSGMATFRHLSYKQFEEVVRQAAALGALVGVHAEDAGIVEGERARLCGRTEMAAYAASRPVRAEVEAIRQVGALAHASGTRLHIVHLSSASGAEEVARLRGLGADISAETCPQYLTFSEQDFGRLGSLIKCAPPIRSVAERDRLWQHVGGVISMFATDHAPCPIEEKQTGNAFSDYAGIAGVELLLPWALTYGWRAGRLTLEQVVELTSRSAARRFGLWPRKGSLLPGSDADFVLVNLEENFVVRGENLHSKGRFSPFEGETFYGRVHATYVRGMAVFKRGTFCRPCGRFVVRGET